MQVFAAVQTLKGPSASHKQQVLPVYRTERDETSKKATSGLGREGMFLAEAGQETGDNSRGSLFWKEMVSWDFGSL